MSVTNPVEIVQIDRRYFLKLAGGALVSLSAFGLAGCGGSGGGSSTKSSTLGKVSGKVVLPSGSSLTFGGLTVSAMGSDSAVTSIGGYSSPVSSVAPTLAMVLNSSGQPILAGFLDSAIAGTQAISAQSTGVVLTYFSLGGWMLPASSKSALLKLLTANSEMVALGATIAQRVAANPLAVSQNDVQITAALATVLNNLGSSEAAEIIEKPFVGNPLLTVSPFADQSGVSVSADLTTLAVDTINTYRRPVQVYVYEVDKVVAGVDIPVSPAKLAAGPYPLAQATLLPPSTTIGGLLSGPNPYQPTSLSPIPISLDGSADQTTYEVVVIGPSASGVKPAFFSAARYANEVSGWISVIQNSYAQVFFGNILLGLQLEIMGFGPVYELASTFETAVQSAVADAGSSYTSPTLSDPSFTPLQLSGSLASLAAKTGAFKRIQADLADIAYASESRVIQSIPPAVFTKIATYAYSLIAPYIATYLSGAVSSYKDMGKTISDLENSDPGVLWTVVIAQNEITLSPATSYNNAGDTVSFTLTLSPDLKSTYSFVWTQTSSNDVLSAVGESNTGISITTQKLSVNLLTSPSDVSPVTVNVTAYDIAGGHKVEVGTASATVNFVPVAKITPANPALAIGAKQTFTASLPSSPTSGTKYIWTLTGTSGSIGGPSVTTTVPTIVYTAIADGTDALQVQVVNSSGVLIAKGGVQVTVGATPVLNFSFAGDFGTTIGFPDGKYSYPGVLGTRETLTDNNNNPVDRIFLVYDVIASTVNSEVFMWLPVGQALTIGQTFSYQGSYAGTFEIFLPESSQGNGATEDPVEEYDVITGAVLNGVLTVTAVSQLSDGTNVLQFKFGFTDSAGGTFSGSGTGTWKPLTSQARPAALKR